MPETKRPLKVFLCHAHADREAVRALYVRLKREGVDVWLDKEKLLPGSDWELEIRTAVRESDVVVVCLSKQFAQKGFRQSEVRIALEEANLQPDGEIFIIPARLEECNVPQNLRRWHWVDLFEDDGYERLLRALQARADKIGAALQAKRNWLHKATNPPKTGKPVPGMKFVELKPEKEKEPPTTGVEIDGNDSGNANVKGSGNGINLEKQETREPVKPVAPKSGAKKRPLRKPNIAVIFALVVFAGAIIVALISSPFIERMLSPEPTPTEMVAATITFTLQPVSLSKTPMPSVTPTVTPTPTPRAIVGETFGEIKLLGKIVPPEDEQFTTADISPDGQLVAISSYDGKGSSVQLWRTDDFSLLKPLDTLDLYLTNILFSPNGSLLAVGAKDGSLRIWEIKTGEQIRSFKDTTASIQKIGFSKDGRKLVASTSSRIEVWDVATGEILDAVNIDVQSFAIDLNDQIGYAVRQPYTTYVYPWDPVKKVYSKTTVPEEHTGYVLNYGSLENIEQSQQLYNNLYGNGVYFSDVFDFSSEGEILLGGQWSSPFILNPANNKVNALSYYWGADKATFSPDGGSIAIANNTSLSLLHINDNKIERIPLNYNGFLTSLAFSRNGWILISCSNDSVDIWGIPRWNSTPTPTITPTPTLAPPTAIQ